MDDGGVNVLVLEGVDTYANVKVNGKLVAETKNAFVEYKIVLNRSDIKFDG